MHIYIMSDSELRKGKMLAHSLGRNIVIHFPRCLTKVKIALKLITKGNQ